MQQCVPSCSPTPNLPHRETALTLGADELQLGPKKKSKKKTARAELDLDALLADNGGDKAVTPLTEPTPSETSKGKDREKEEPAASDAELDALLAEIDAPAPAAPVPAPTGGGKKKKKGETAETGGGCVVTVISKVYGAVTGKEGPAHLAEGVGILRLPVPADTRNALAVVHLLRRHGSIKQCFIVAAHPCSAGKGGKGKADGEEEDLDALLAELGVELPASAAGVGSAAASAPGGPSDATEENGGGGEGGPATSAAAKRRAKKKARDAAKKSGGAVEAEGGEEPAAEESSEPASASAKGGKKGAPKVSAAVKRMQAALEAQRRAAEEAARLAEEQRLRVSCLVLVLNPWDWICCAGAEASCVWDICCTSETLLRCRGIVLHSDDRAFHPRRRRRSVLLRRLSAKRPKQLKEGVLIGLNDLDNRLAQGGCHA